jgi:diadenosine tetraphosphate (Ap4A) HIT family hydrolase
VTFALDDRLARDTFAVGDMALSRVLLMNDVRWPWLILVPRRAGLIEIFDLDAADRMQLTEETAHISRFLKAYAGAHKINVATLGNIVRQFHLHVVARTAADPAWPGPVWGFGAAVPRDKAEARTLVAAARAGLGMA